MPKQSQIKPNMSIQRVTVSPVSSIVMDFAGKNGLRPLHPKQGVKDSPGDVFDFDFSSSKKA